MNPIVKAWENRGEGSVYVTSVHFTEPPSYRQVTSLKETKTPEGDPGPVIVTVEGSKVGYAVEVLTLVIEPEGTEELFDFIAADDGPVSWEDITKGWDSADIEWVDPRLSGEEALEMLREALEWLTVTGAVIEDSGDEGVTYRVKPEEDPEPDDGAESSQPDPLLTLYASLTGDEIGDDAGRDEDILDVIRACIDSPNEESAVTVLREAGWDTANAEEERNEALLRYAQAFRLADERQAFDDLLRDSQKREELPPIFRHPPPKISPETWKRLAEEAGEVIERTGSGLFCAKCETPAPKDFLATGWGVTENGVLCPDCHANPDEPDVVGELGSYRYTPTGNRKEQARAKRRRVVWKPDREVWAAICWKADELSEEGKPVAPHDLARQIAEDAAGAVVREHQEALQRGALADVPTQILLEVAADREPALAKELLELRERATE